MRKILVVDDEPQIVDVVGKFLSREGFQIDKAYNGLEALDVIKKDIPDLMILDIKMSGMDGDALIKKVKKLKLDIPIIVLTGSLNMVQFDPKQKTRYKHLLYKPIRLSELLEVINDVLGARAGA